MPINTNKNLAPRSTRLPSCSRSCGIRSLLSVVVAVAGVFVLSSVGSGSELGNDETPSRAGSAVKPVGTEPCAERLAAVIQAHYESVDDFSANFRQRTQSVMLGKASLGADAPSTGFVQFAKPGKMRWRYETPAKSLVISDGKILWIYDPEAREAQRLPVTEGYLTGAVLEFLLGEGKILDEFEVEVSSCVPDAQDALELTLIPKERASYESLGLRAHRLTGEILATSLVDLFGNRTVISFSDTRINLHPDASTFRFEIPSSVQVIDLVPAP